MTIAQTLTASFRTISDQLTTVAQQAQDEYDAITGAERRRRAACATELGRRSTERSATPSSAAQQPNDLMDRRDLLIDKLSPARAGVGHRHSATAASRVDFGGVDARRPEHADRLHVAADARHERPGGKLGALLDLASRDRPDADLPHAARRGRRRPRRRRQRAAHPAARRLLRTPPARRPPRSPSSRPTATVQTGSGSAVRRERRRAGDRETARRHDRPALPARSSRGSAPSRRRRERARGDRAVARRLRSRTAARASPASRSTRR